jgi:hypothetical protein
MLAAAVAQIVEQLRGVGLSAVTDPRNAHPPCALVLPRTATPRTSCTARVGMEILLIAPGAGNGDALAWLDTALAAAWHALPVRWPAQLVEWISPHTGTPLLAWSLERDTDITITTRPLEA